MLVMYFSSSDPAVQVHSAEGYLPLGQLLHGLGDRQGDS